jgi:putative cardiolipin synthase
VQYCLIHNDEIGQQFLRELRAAALRGVRVRLLVDDLYTAGENALLAGLAAYPNVEVRLFNPLPVRAGSFGWRLLFSLHELGRINHRMHNKQFIADNSFAVLGGRNIADEYFMHSAAANFIDLDVLTSGPVVRELSAVFDTYWNSEEVLAIAGVVEPVPPAEAQQRLDDLVRNAHCRAPSRRAGPHARRAAARQRRVSSRPSRPRASSPTRPTRRPARYAVPARRP